jgi:hypothetical protein
MEHPRIFAPPRLVGLGSSRPSMAPWLLTPILLLQLPAEPEAIGLTGVAPPTPLAGPQTR